MYGVDNLVFSVFLIFSGAALLSTVAVFTRQSLLVAYILLGALLGPWGIRLVHNPLIIRQIGDVGIIFLLFLLGLNLRPQSLLRLLQKTIGVTFLTSFIFAAIGYLIARLFGFSDMEGFVIGLAMMFSSTIVGLKLLPSNVLHHRETGEVMISILLLQDLMAIGALLFLQFLAEHSMAPLQIAQTFLALPCLLLFAYGMQRFVLNPLLRKFVTIREYIFLLSIGWCLGMAQLSGFLGLSEGIGAFIAGITLASTPISQYIAENLKPLRDFFLVMFFFCVGAYFRFQYLDLVLLPAFILSALILFGKPIIFQSCLKHIPAIKPISLELGMRLGQASEFSLLIAYMAANAHLIGALALLLIQTITIITFIFSSYAVVLFYPSPMAMTEKLRQE